MFAGDCPSEANAYNVSQASTIPGGVSGSTSGMPSPTVPLGLASLLVTSPTTGLPHAGVTIRLTTPPLPAAGRTPTTCPTTGADGLSRTAVPYGAYSVYLNGSGSAYGTLVVAGNTQTLVGTTTVLPNPARVTCMRRRKVLPPTSGAAGEAALPRRRPRPSTGSRGDEGLTLVELLVAFTALIVLFGIMGNILTTYLSGRDHGDLDLRRHRPAPAQLDHHPRLIRSQVEPAPTLTTTVGRRLRCGQRALPGLPAGSRRALLDDVLRQRRGPRAPTDRPRS